MKGPLDGFYESGYDYYAELRGNVLSLRDYARVPILRTEIRYDRTAAEKKERTEIAFETGGFRYGETSPVMIAMTSLVFDGEDFLLTTYYELLDRRTEYRLKKVDHGPFDYIRIRDKEILPRVAGVWYGCGRDGRENGETLEIKKNELSFCYDGQPLCKMKIHAASYDCDPGTVLLISEDLTAKSLGAWSFLTVGEKMLTCYPQITDVTPPMSVYLRREDVGKIPLPPEALREARNAMLRREEPPVTVDEIRTEENAK
ncbi:MAG: hypothetical protein IJR89_07240 [Clostridia bacterium]|nr:hypothetical protein [Clostridia bacterium]